MNKPSIESKFTPDYSPVEMITLGVFGGIYFNDPKWLVDLPYSFKKFLLGYPSQYWNNKIPNKNVNTYKVLAGTDQSVWEQSGWLKAQDPRGWFQWYINYYYGRRSEDDIRQINRWISFKARHSGMLKAHLTKNKSADKASLYPVMRQGLLQWGVNSEK